MFAIEMSNDAPTYGSLHAAGCRDLRDPMTFEVDGPATAENVAAAVEDATGWDFTAASVKHYAKPCARKLLTK